MLCFPDEDHVIVSNCSVNDANHSIADTDDLFIVVKACIVPATCLEDKLITEEWFTGVTQIL